MNKDLKRGVLLASITAIMWGFLAVALKVSLDFASAGTTVWFRFAFSFVALLLFMLRREPAKVVAVLRRPPLLGVLASLGLASNYVGYMHGVALTGPSNTQVIIQLGPLLLIVVGAVAFDERMRLAQLVGLGVAALGFGLFYYDQLRLLWASAGNFNTGNAWILFAAVAWTLYGALQKHLVHLWDPRQVNLVLYGVAAILIFPLCNFHEFVHMSLGTWVLLALLALNTLVAYGALAEAFKLAPANVISVIITVNPIITVVSMAILGAMHVSWIAPEAISWRGYVGATLALAGVARVVSAKSTT